MNRLLAAAFALLLSAVLSQLFAKGETTKIRIQGLYLKAPIELVDPVILSKVNVWSGPGTWSSDPGFNVNALGFIIDRSSGAVPEVPDRLTSYKVSFYAKLPNERLAYVVYYACDPRLSTAYVYLPGKDDQSYSLNVGTITRGVEGQWFRSSSTWDDIALPLIKNARVGRNPSEPGLDPGEPGIISGTVVDSAGQPIHDAKVWLEEFGAMRPREWFYYIEADQNGRFRFFHLRPGDYNVYVVPADASPLPRWKQAVPLSRDKPVGKTTVQVGSEKNAG